MSTKTLLCIGYGYTAKAFAKRLRADGWSVIGTTRDPGKAHDIKDDDALPLVLSKENHEAIKAALGRATAILISSPPGDDGCPALELATQFPKHIKTTSWIGYLSSNGVYGDHDGAWVNEETTPTPTSARGKRRLAAENDWLAFAQTHHLNVKVFRLPGIYGPDRSAIDTVRQGKAKRIVKPGQIFNRMHVEDIATALYNSLTIKTEFTLFNLCDDVPSPPQDVVTYACELFELDPPPLIALEDADMSPMGKSFYRDNKRVRNTRMKEVLGVKLQYPDYKTGLRGILKA